MNKRALIWAITLTFTLMLFIAMGYIGIVGMDKMGIYTIKIEEEAAK